MLLADVLGYDFEEVVAVLDPIFEDEEGEVAEDESDDHYDQAHQHHIQLQADGLAVVALGIAHCLSQQLGEQVLLVLDDPVVGVIHCQLRYVTHS